MNLSSDRVKAQAKVIGFHKVGIVSVETQKEDSAIDRLNDWLALGYQADMGWMANPKREDIRLVMPEVRSLISVALNYYTPHQHSDAPEDGKISRYGWGRDYHKVMQQKLKQLSQWLQKQEAGIKTRYYADTGAIQDKYGSWVFLGEILTNIELTPDKPHTQHCGTCTRCLDACPTDAIAKPFVIDANRCIAYHTIENREPEIPQEIATKLSGWIAGCDICQDVCPWNQRFARETDVADFQPYSWNIQPKLQELAHIQEAEWDRRFRASALRRIKPSMLRRNARANLIFRDKT